MHACRLGGLWGSERWLSSLRAHDGSRFMRLGTQIGLVGLVLGEGWDAVRLARLEAYSGMGLMLAGALMAFFAYVIPLADPSVHELPG